MEIMNKMNDYGIGITGTGHYLPSHIQTNEELCEIITDLTPEEILTKTGIKRRFLVSDDESASSMALKASSMALERAGVEAKDIGLIIVASFSQDYLFPPLSAKIHAALKVPKNCQIIDVNTACAGPVTAITMASERMYFERDIKHALVIAVEVLSRFTDTADKDTAIFFSDGASAVVLSEVEAGKGFAGAKFLTDSSTYESVRLRGGGSSYPANKTTEDLKALYIEQNGLATWKQAVTNFPVVINNLLTATGKSINEIDFFVFHQANGFLIDYLMKKMKVPSDKTYTNVEEIGNTGSASIGIALSEAFEKGLIKSKDNVVLAGIGAGFNFGACLIKMP
jgi:3-oxoacyl-[acyl-carrier-protein] synthase-3